MHGNQKPMIQIEHVKFQVYRGQYKRIYSLHNACFLRLRLLEISQRKEVIDSACPKKNENWIQDVRDRHIYFCTYGKQYFCAYVWRREKILWYLPVLMGCPIEYFKHWQAMKNKWCGNFVSNEPYLHWTLARRDLIIMNVHGQMSLTAGRISKRSACFLCKMIWR